MKGYHQISKEAWTANKEEKKQAGTNDNEIINRG